MSIHITQSMSPHFTRINFDNVRYNLALCVSYVSPKLSNKVSNKFTFIYQVLFYLIISWRDNFGEKNINFTNFCLFKVIQGYFKAILNTER